MPPAVQQQSPALSISLAEGSRPFAPGETITGRVHRQAHYVDPSSTVLIRLMGRAKTKITVRRNNSTSNYRSRVNFFGDAGVGVVIYQGPIHIPPNSSESHSWPFAITIPPKPFPGCFQAGQGQCDPLIPPQQVEAMPLSASFAQSHLRMLGKTGEGYVEYHLEAQICDSHKAATTSILPIHIRSRASPSPITDFSLVTGTPMQAYVSSQRLLPGMEDMKLTFGQKTKKLFRSSSVPQYHFALHIEMPSVLQLGSPNVFPFLIRAVPNWSRTSEPIHNIAQTLIVKEFRLRVESFTKIIAPGAFSNYEVEDDTSYTVVHYRRTGSSKSQVWPPEGALPAYSQAPEEKPKAAKEEEAPPSADDLIVPLSTENQSLDLGKALSLRLTSATNRLPLNACFSTYNIYHAHNLRWNIVISIAGEDVKLGSQKQVVLMGPSDEQMR